MSTKYTTPTMSRWARYAGGTGFGLLLAACGGGSFSATETRPGATVGGEASAGELSSQGGSEAPQSGGGSAGQTAAAGSAAEPSGGRATAGAPAAAGAVGVAGQNTAGTGGAGGGSSGGAPASGGADPATGGDPATTDCAILKTKVGCAACEISFERCGDPPTEARWLTSAKGLVFECAAASPLDCSDAEERAKFWLANECCAP